MAQYREIDDLRRKKQVLLVRSRAYREAIHAEALQLEAATAWVEKAIRLVRKAYPVFLVLAPLAGYFTVKKGPSMKGLWSRGLIGYQVFSRMLPVWQRWRARRRAEV